MTVKHNIDINAVTAAWTTLNESLGELHAVRSDEELTRYVDVLDYLLDVTRGNDEHPLVSLVDLLSDLVEAYETRSLGESDAPPADVLRLLMEANSLTQADLAQEFGGQPVVSAVLNGHRTINARQAGALAARFGVSAAVFIAIPARESLVPSAIEEVRRAVSTVAMGQAILPKRGIRTKFTDRNTTFTYTHTGVLPLKSYVRAKGDLPRGSITMTFAKEYA